MHRAHDPIGHADRLGHHRDNPAPEQRLRDLDRQGVDPTSPGMRGLFRRDELSSDREAERKGEHALRGDDPTTVVAVFGERSPDGTGCLTRGGQQPLDRDQPSHATVHQGNDAAQSVDQPPVVDGHAPSLPGSTRIPKRRLAHHRGGRRPSRASTSAGRSEMTPSTPRSTTSLMSAAEFTVHT